MADHNFQEARLRNFIKKCRADGMNRSQARAAAREKFTAGLSPEVRDLILKLIELFLAFFFK
jgi:hypothetical protein